MTNEKDSDEQRKRDSLRSFEHFLNDRGLRLTAQRELIARLFLETEGHVSTEEVYRKVREINPSVGSATVYRTIKILAEAGLASPQSFGDGFIRYEASDAQSHHDHLICTKCGKIVEFQNERIESLQEQVARDYGFKVSDHKMELCGICHNCSG